MLIIRTYLVMGSPAVEVSCVHGSSPMESHLLYRAQAHEPTSDFLDALEVLDECLRSLARLVLEGDVTVSDDCLFG